MAGRFELEARAGAGGMGVVFRARDRQSGETVALKLLHVGQPSDRFLREAGTLAEVSHPAVVRYVAHGTIDDERPYLAMEWIDGTSLADLLKQRKLTTAEALTVVRRVAEGLSAAHRSGVVHRDVKPSNVYLPAGVLADAKIIDFGVARRPLDPHITESGLLVGTLAYMSPEQASSDPDILPTSDVFSLGCVLYKCLTGESPFSGGDATAVLAKVLLEEPAPVRELVPEVPPAVEELVARMLAKRRSDRPEDADAVIAAIDALGDVAALPAGAGLDPVLTAQERRVVWVVLVGGVSPEDSETREMRVPSAAVAPSIRIDACATKYGGRYAVLADGTGVATFSGSGAPTDEAVRAVRCGLEMLELVPERPVTVAMGLGVVGGRVPVGEAIDHGVAVLARATRGALRVDALTARLIGTRYSVQADGEGLFVAGERRGVDATRKLLGRPTPHVGRDRELLTLEALFDECAGEPVARAALVVGPAGVGKSRLRYELVERLRSRGAELELFMGRADPMSAGSPFALLREAIRRSANILDGEPIGESRRKLLARLEQSGDPEAARRNAPFIGEIARVPFDVSASEALRAARADPTLMGDSMRLAWIEFLARECAVRPVLLVLEDLHWGDGPTMSFVDAALANLAEAPLMVLCLARPEVHDVLPRSWKERDIQELSLRPLLRAASESLVRDVLGDAVPEATLARVVELADGNAFHLEELIRAVAEGREELPESVLGMVQTRLEALEPEERRLLRAASVFGKRFWLGGVAALVGNEQTAELASEGLAELVERELVTERTTSALSGEKEYVFRHALLREAAYAMLTEADRALGHRLAAEWLEQAGETEPLVLAEHFHRGGVPERAAQWYARAAEQALEGNDFAAVLENVDRALACDPMPVTRGELAYFVGHARAWRGEHHDAQVVLRDAIALLPRGSARWFSVVSDLSHVASCLDDDAAELEALEIAIGAAPEDDSARAAQIACLARTAVGRLKTGDVERADALLAHTTELSRSVGDLADVASAWIHHARSARAYYVGDVANFALEIALAAQGFESIRDVRNATTDRINLGYLRLQLGLFEEAEAELRAGFALAERLGLISAATYALHNLGFVLGYLDRVDEGIVVERRALELSIQMGENKLTGAIYTYLAMLLCQKGDAADAEEAARGAIEALAAAPPLLSYAHAALASAHLIAQRPRDALGEARRAMDLLDAHGGPEEVDARVRLVLARAADAADDSDTALAAIRGARLRLLERASRIDDERLRRSFLERVPEHRSTLELAEAWLD